MPRHLMLPHQRGDGGVAIQTKGMMGVYVIERVEVPAMMYDADRGHYTAAQVRDHIGSWMGGAFIAAPPKCSGCDHTFATPVEPEGFYVAIPYRGNGNSLVVGVCKRCVRRIGSDGLLAHAIEHFKKVWPDSVVTGDVPGAAKR